MFHIWVDYFDLCFLAITKCQAEKSLTYDWLLDIIGMTLLGEESVVAGRLGKFRTDIFHIWF